MREIKFRAWIKDYALMTDVNFLNIDYKEIVVMIDKNDYEFGCGEYELMQYTGLKDKNGREIYDGDILKRRVHLVMYGTDLDEWVDDIAVVKWRDEYAGFYIGERELFAEIKTTIDSATRCECTEFEVVGNIYQNPELLEVAE